MSTFAYSALTNVRKQTPPDKDGKTDKPGVATYVDATAALVPAEVLALHAVLLTFTTETAADGATRVTEGTTLAASFWGLIALSLLIYFVNRERSGLDRLDILRAAVPPLAFTCWTMLQKATAFDAVAPAGLTDAPRMAIALFGAVVLGTLTTWLARRASADPAA